jgi:hypothetical protein
MLLQRRDPFLEPVVFSLDTAELTFERVDLATELRSL